MIRCGTLLCKWLSWKVNWMWSATLQVRAEYCQESPVTHATCVVSLNVYPCMRSRTFSIKRETVQRNTAIRYKKHRKFTSKIWDLTPWMFRIYSCQYEPARNHRESKRFDFLGANQWCNFKSYHTSRESSPLRWYSAPCSVFSYDGLLLVPSARATSVHLRRFREYHIYVFL